MRGARGKCGFFSTTGKQQNPPPVLPDESSALGKNILVYENRNTYIFTAIPPRHEGRDGHSSPDVRRAAMDAWRRKTCDATRTVKPCGPDPPTLGSSEWR